MEQPAQKTVHSRPGVCPGRTAEHFLLAGYPGKPVPCQSAGCLAEPAHFRPGCSLRGCCPLPTPAPGPPMLIPWLCRMAMAESCVGFMPAIAWSWSDVIEAWICFTSALIWSCVSALVAWAVGVVLVPAWEELPCPCGGLPCPTPYWGSISGSAARAAGAISPGRRSLPEPSLPV